MYCPNCKGKDCQEFYNEPMEVRETHYTPASIFFGCIGFIMFLVAGILFMRTAVSDTTLSIIRGIISLVGLFIFAFSLLIGAQPHYKQIYRIKVFCKKCGYQYILTQADIKEINFHSVKKYSTSQEAQTSKPATPSSNSKTDANGFSISGDEKSADNNTSVEENSIQ